MDIAKSLRLVLAERNMRKGKLAKLAGVSAQQVSNWLRTGSMPQATLERLCGSLGYSVSEFIAKGEDK